MTGNLALEYMHRYASVSDSRHAHQRHSGNAPSGRWNSGGARKIFVSFWVKNPSKATDQGGVGSAHDEEHLPPPRDLRARDGRCESERGGAQAAPRPPRVDERACGARGWRLTGRLEAGAGAQARSEDAPARRDVGDLALRVPPGPPGSGDRTRSIRSRETPVGPPQRCLSR